MRLIVEQQWKRMKGSSDNELSPGSIPVERRTYTYALSFVGGVRIKGILSKLFTVLALERESAPCARR